MPGRSAPAVWQTSTDSALRWTPVVRLSGELYPSYVLATATADQWGDGARFDPTPGGIGDRLGVLGVRVVPSRDSMHLTVTVELPGLAEPSATRVTLGRAGDTVLVRPQMLFDYEALLKVRQPRPVNARFRVAVDSMPVGETVRVVRVRSVNDVPYSQAPTTDEPVEPLFWMFGAFVNENHPLVDAILREALATGQSPRGFIGYQGTPMEVRQQVWAIWSALQKRGIRYSSITTPSAVNVGVASQHVRSFEESLAAGQANCVDGTVLFASLLRKIGIDVQLVMVPGHMFLSYFLRPGRLMRDALETTMLGSTELAQLPQDGSLGGAVAQLLGGDTQLTASAKVFDAARASGRRRFDESLAAINDRMPGYALLDVAAIRARGIMPINK